MSTKNLTIRIRKEQEGNFDKIVGQLKRHGLTSVSPAKRFLIVNGTADEKEVPKLQTIQGIASVNQEQVFSTTL